tara:strand:+ start:1373 stop:1540 length:168 start_codon:yes stop_codon:yes gene_type:complete
MLLTIKKALSNLLLFTLSEFAKMNNVSIAIHGGAWYAGIAQNDIDGIKFKICTDK